MCIFQELGLDLSNLLFLFSTNRTVFNSLEHPFTAATEQIIKIVAGSHQQVARAMVENVKFCIYCSYSKYMKKYLCHMVKRNVKFFHLIEPTIAQRC